MANVPLNTRPAGFWPILTGTFVGHDVGTRPGGVSGWGAVSESGQRAWKPAVRAWTTTEHIRASAPKDATLQSFTLESSYG